MYHKKKHLYKIPKQVSLSKEMIGISSVVIQQISMLELFTGFSCLSHHFHTHVCLLHDTYMITGEENEMKIEQRRKSACFLNSTVKDLPVSEGETLDSI